VRHRNPDETVMNISGTLKLIGLAVVLSGCVQGVSAQRSILVTGRAVNARRNPVHDAVVTLYAPPCRTCFEHVLPTARSLADGTFVIDAGASLKDLRLFISEPVPTGFWSPLNDPSLEELSHPKIFRSSPVRVPKGHSMQVDLGDIAVLNRYARVILQLPTIPLGNARRDSDDSVTADLILLDSRKRTVFSGPLPDAAFDRTSGSVNLALPRGRWTLKLLLKLQGKRMPSIHSISVTKFSEPINVKVSDSN
jgi:hypothetical protein